MFVSLMRVCVVYVVKEVMSFLGLSKLMGVAHKRTLARALQTSRKKAAWSYIETRTNSWVFYLKYIPKVLQSPLKGKESR